MLNQMRVVRAGREMTLSDLESRLPGLDRFRLARYERGERPRSVEEIAQIAEALGVDPEVLTARTISISASGTIKATRRAR